MTRLLSAASFLALLSACGDGNWLFDADGNPLDGATLTDTTGSTDEDTTNGDIDNDGATPAPGTENPALDESIFRFEARDDAGGGLVSQVSYNRSADTFTVDNLAFDGANVYQRNEDLGTLNGYRVFAADESTDDFLTGSAVSQIVPYRAIYGVSANRVDGDPRTSFAIVRTGGYIGHGFGGYVYERNGGTVLPETGQATFSGDYGGVWTFNGIGGLAYVQGDMTMDIDFADFNENAGVKGRVINRVLLDESGANIGAMPNINWVVEEGVMTLDANGEINTQVFTQRIDTENGIVRFFEGTFIGLAAGDLTDSDDGGEIVGIIEMDASATVAPGAELADFVGNTVPDDDGGTTVGIKETGGAILTRN